MNKVYSRNYRFRTLIRFAVPSIFMQIFLSLYTIADGMFVSRFVGTVALSAINIVFPVTSLALAIAIMLATGGSAIVGIQLGEKQEEKARKSFSLIIATSFVISVIMAVLGTVFLNQIVKFLGASELQFADAKAYLGIILIFIPALFLQSLFQIFFVVAGKPSIGLTVTMLAGITNIVLDYIFIKYFGMGIAGAAVATGLGYCIPSITGIFYFFRKENKQLYFVKPEWNTKIFIDSCFNGSSEMTTNLANAVTTFLFNYIFMKFYGESGVASITIILYFQFIIIAIFFGYSIGVAPIISYKYGEKNHRQLHEILKYSLYFLTISSVTMFGIAIITINPVLLLFTSKNTDVFSISINGFPLYAISFIVAGFNIFASTFFTALSDGKVSAIISFLRTFLFLSGAIIILPMMIGERGIWLATTVAELLGLGVSIYYIVSKRKKYGY